MFSAWLTAFSLLHAAPEDSKAKAPKPGLREQLETFVANARRFLQRMAGIKEMDDDALALYREHMEKEAAKKSATSALERLKSGRGANNIMLVKSARTDKSDRRIMGRASTARLEAREDSDDDADKPSHLEKRTDESRTRRKRRRRLRRRRKKPVDDAGVASDAKEAHEALSLSEEAVEDSDHASDQPVDKDEEDEASSTSSSSSEEDDKASKPSSKPSSATAPDEKPEKA
ncbi:Ddhd2 [Symbiodinium natans]|uniref:Ddhd2 protein n=1 Tax=Symbiodinium natans TaxID=878477 RepID=A0A812QZR7_9DINO|nr:Ddhd2 [Symbiodinium natans]